MIVLMCSWLSFVDVGNSKQYSCLEFFAGVGRIARLSHARGYEAACYDVLYDPLRVEKTKHTSEKKSCMDFSSDAGFVYLDCVWFTLHLVFLSYVHLTYRDIIIGLL